MGQPVRAVARVVAASSRLGAEAASVPAAFVLAVAIVVVAAACDGLVLPSPPRACDALTGVGCLPDEVCVDGLCELLGRCAADADCPSAAWRCTFPAQFCTLREGFGEECSATAPCPAGEFCSLGQCRVAADARPCGSRLDCAPGFACDKLSFFCVEEAPCSLATAFPEVACDPGESCSPSLDACVAACAGQCTPETEAQDCGPSQRCNGACRCVQCLADVDCGTGLVCNVRSGQCQSDDLCFSDDDCAAPLICDPRTALCQVAPPACFDDFDCAIAERCNVATGRCELPGGACVDDRFEDADTPANAEDIALVVDEPKLLDDLQLCPDDDDVYVFALAAGDRLTVRASRTVPEARATLWLLDENAETSIAFAETVPRGNGTVTTTAEIDGVVYLRVNALLAATPYDLEATVTRAGACAADFFETGGGAADNDTIATATDPLFAPPGVLLGAELCADDVDIYAFDVGAGEGVRATLAFDPTLRDLDVALLDGSGLVLEQAASAVEPEIVERRFVEPTTVFVRVRGFGNGRGPYTLQMDRLAPLVCSDAFEPDDDAPRIVQPLNSTASGSAGVVEGRALCSAGVADADRWAVDLLDFERVVAVAAPDDGDLRVVLTVEDEAGVVLARSPSGQGASSVGFDAVTAGRVYLRAVGAFGQVGTYTATIRKENRGSCAPDAREPNDTVATAAPLPDVNEVVTICESDEDLFVLPGVAGKRAVVDLAFRHGDGDLDLQLLGIDGRQILATSDSQSDGEHLEVLLPVDGNFTVRVFSLTSGARSRYTLTTALVSP
jgi:hypothetical protein